MFKRLAIALVALVGGLVALSFLIPVRVYYRDRRPTRIGRFANNLMAKYSAAGGPPSWQVVLEVPGRKSGIIHRQPLVRTDVDGGQYFVSMLGERSGWVHNVRANGGRGVVCHGSTKPVRLTEVPVEERAPVLRAYVARAISGRRHFPVTVDAPLSEFERIAAGYPVFRIEPAEA